MVGMEALARALRENEEKIKKRRLAKEPYSDSQYYRGRPAQVGGALFAPDLRKFLSDAMSAESAILKERRKAAEEQKALKATGKTQG